MTEYTTGDSYTTASRTAIENKVIREGLWWLKRLSSRTMESGAYYYATIDKISSRGVRETVAVVRGYKWYDSERRTYMYEFTGLSKKVLLTEREALNRIKSYTKKKSEPAPFGL